MLSPGTPPPRPSRFDSDTLAVLRVSGFRSFAIARLSGTVANTLLQALILWQVYAISGSYVDLGLVGLVRFLPSLALSLVGGAVADAYDRRTVLLLAQSVPLLITAAMLYAIAHQQVTLLVLYGVVLVSGLAQSFEGPASLSVVPAVVPRPLFRRAIALSSTAQTLGAITGPAVAGVLIATSGPGSAYVAFGLLYAVAIGAILTLKMPPMEGPRRKMQISAIREGITFVRHRPVLLGAMTLDMFAVVFGGARALLPVYAVTILHAGAMGYGALAASTDVGSLLMSLVIVSLPLPTRTGRALLLSVAAYGLATALFGLSQFLPLSIFLYALVGMADQLSVVMRQTTIQLAVPDALRGRVTAVNSVFINASNQLGGVESGFLANVTGPVFAVVSGGIASVVVVAVVAVLVPQMRGYISPRTDDAESESALASL